MAPAETPSTAQDDGLLVLLPAGAGGARHYWQVSGGELRKASSGDLPAEGARVVALVPADRAPVRSRPLDGMPLAQALTAARLEADGQFGASGGVHVAVAPAEEDAGVLIASAAHADMQGWLAELADEGLDPEALVPLAAILPGGAGTTIATIAGQPVARTAQAAFAGEIGLIEAFGTGPSRELAELEVDEALLAAWRAPPLNLRQGIYAPKQRSIWQLPAWRQLARMAAVAALLLFLIFAIETAKLNWDASSREQAALEAAQQRFPGAVDLATAQSLTAAELARRGQGGGSFSAPASAVLAAMRPIPSLKLRDLGYNADGTLRFQAAAPSADDINRLLIVLQQEGWQVTVPPSLAPDPTGATVAAITVRAP